MKLKTLFFPIIISLSLSYAGESQFGLVNKSFGNIKLPYSASGIARSYEIAYSDSVHLNSMNFSTLTNKSQTTFSLNLDYNAYWGENRVEKTFVDNANFSGVFLAIPIIQRQLVFGAGVQPYTSIEQRLVNEFSLNGDNHSENIYINGGLSKANFNLAYKVLDNMSIGLGYEFTFGKITENVHINIEDDISSTVEFDSESQVSGNGLILSMFATPLQDLNVGLMIRPSVLGEITKSAESQSDVLNIEDTYDLTLPTELNFGAEYSFSQTYSIGMDLTWQDWKNGYKIDDAKVNQHNTFYHFGLGFEKRGSSRRFVKYGQQIDFRIGGFYNQLSSLSNGKKVNEIGFSAGLSLPIIRFRSKIDLAGFVSRRGSLSKNVLQETIVGFSFSISANEIWFINLED